MGRRIVTSTRKISSIKVVLESSFEGNPDRSDVYSLESLSYHVNDDGGLSIQEGGDEIAYYDKGWWGRIYISYQEKPVS